MNNRSIALDALRGLAIIGMVLSGTIAHSLPAWMYHAQVGPRSGFNFDPTIPGITWVDLVFPFFLFAMGAAMPLALNRKLDNGVKPLSLIPSILKRFFLLCLFAISIYHTTPYRLGGTWNYLQAVGAFLLFFAAFVQLPAMSKRANNLINLAGTVLLICLIAFNVLTQPEVFSKGFKLSHNDIIILILANMALFGTIIWLLTRTNVLVRLGILAFLLAFRLSSDIDGSWNQLVWNFNPMMLLPESITSILYNPGGWLYQMDFLKYLFIVIPGTLVGDLIAQGFKDSNQQMPDLKSKSSMLILLLVSVTFVVGNLICLYSRYLVLQVLMNIVLSVIGLILLAKPQNSTTRMYFRIVQWGVFWLLLGSVFEAFEGGIRKDHATMSYFFVSSGLAIFTLVFFSIVMEYFSNKKIFRYVSEIGQNPMLAYVAGTFLVLPLLVFVGLMPQINKLHEITPWFGLLKGLIITGGMMVVTVITVRRKWFWKT